MTAAGMRTSEERQLALLVANASDYAIFMLDPGGRILTWNPGAERLYGYPAEETIGLHFSAFYTEEDLARDHPADELRRAVADGRYEEEGWRIRKDGSRFWATVVITPIYDIAGDLLGFGKVSRDLTARRLVEEQLRAKALELETVNRQLAEFRRLVSSVRDYAIFMLDPRGCVRTWNAGARKMKGYEEEEIVGRHFSTFYTQPDRDRDHPANELEIATREGRYEEEGWRVRKDGTTFWASVTITAVRDEQGVLTGFAKVTRDLSARRKADEELAHALQELRVANEELERFASVAAHDISDPLRTIAGFAELLAGAELPAREAEFVEHIRTTSERLAHLLDSLLRYARAGRSQRPSEPVDVRAAAERVRAALAGPIDERGAEIRIELPAGVRVLALPADVELLLQNLVSNAVKFGDPERPVVRLSAEPGGAETWRLVVEDNGPGIAEDDRVRIFHPFERAHTGVGRAGHGLGLAICQRLAEHHGGRIDYEPAAGGGSRFSVTLPAAAPA